MQANEPLLATIAFVAAVVVSLVDGRRAIAYASMAAALGLAPVVAAVYGGDAALLLVGAAASVAVAAPLARLAARRLGGPGGIDPSVPAIGAGGGLFGPRSVRTATAVAVLPAASWVSFNIPLGSTSTVTGVIFPAALLGGCASMRLVTARSINDLAVGVAALGIAGAAAWFLAAGVDTLAGAAAAASLAPAVGVVVGWLGGHHAPIHSVTHRPP